MRRRLARLQRALILHGRRSLHGPAGHADEARITLGAPARRRHARRRLTELDDRARDIFRRIVETYLETGEPVGSRTLSRAGIGLSPASIRNTMQDLTLAGPAGRAAHPRRAPADPRGPAAVRRRPAGGRRHRRGGAARDRGAAGRRGRRFEEALNEASPSCRAWPAGPGSSSRRCARRGVKHVEFVALGPDQALAVLVFDDGTVENRLMPLRPG